MLGPWDKLDNGLCGKNGGSSELGEHTGRAGHFQVLARRPTIYPAAQLETSHSPLATTHHLTSEVQTSLSHKDSGRLFLAYLLCSRLYLTLPLVIHPTKNAWISTSLRMKFQLRLDVVTSPQHSILLPIQLSKVLATLFTKSICFNNPRFASVPEHPVYLHIAFPCPYNPIVWNYSSLPFLCLLHTAAPIS